MKLKIDISGNDIINAAKNRLYFAISEDAVITIKHTIILIKNTIKKFSFIIYTVCNYLQHTYNLFL